jgi:small acid-soluble spore protein E (minor gamma-type SASP)
MIMKQYTVAGTDIEEVKRLNAQSQQGGSQTSGLPMQGGMKNSGQYGTEFASDTDVQEVKNLNAQSEAKKNQNNNSQT